MAEKRESKKTKKVGHVSTPQEVEEGEKVEVEEKILGEEIEKIEKAPEEVLVEEVKKPAIEVSTEWVPKTELGKKILEGKITDIEYIFSEGLKISEPEIVDFLVKNINSEIVFIGGSAGKGGGIRRTSTKRTARMHKSGRRYSASALVIVGNGNGYVGLGFASGTSQQQRETIARAVGKAKLNIIPIRRGCGSWECACGEAHSIPFRVSGRSGSVAIDLKPAPKGIGLCVSEEVKNLMRLAGIKDVWSKTRGQTQSRINQVRAAFEALKKINKFRSHPEFDKNVALKTGRVD